MGLQRGKNEIDGRNSRKNRDKSRLERVRRCSIALIDRSACRHATNTIRQYIETHFCIGNCTVYETVVSRSLIFTPYSICRSFTSLSKPFRVFYTLWFLITTLRHFLKFFPRCEIFLVHCTVCSSACIHFLNY